MNKRQSWNQLKELKRIHRKYRHPSKEELKALGKYSGMESQIQMQKIKKVQDECQLSKNIE